LKKYPYIAKCRNQLFDFFCTRLLDDRV